MALLATTKLEAVNMMLSGIGEAPVTTLADDTIEDASIAETILDQIIREVLSSGWHFNTDYDYGLSVDGNQKIPYPTSAAHVDAMKYTGYDVVQRSDGTSQFLYDRTNRTFTFSGLTTLKCKVIWIYEFEELPQAFRSWIALRAALRYAKHIMGDEATVTYSADDEREARALAVQDDIRRADHNVLTDNWSTFRTVGRRRAVWPV